MFDIETEMGDVLSARLNQHREDAISLLVAHGYKVTKPRTKTVKVEQPKLNAVGKPFSPSYDPKYRMKYRTPALSRKQNLPPIEGWSYTNNGAWNVNV
jgi:hypothetical protein